MNQKYINHSKNKVVYPIFLNKKTYENITKISAIEVIPYSSFLRNKLANLTHHIRSAEYVKLKFLTDYQDPSLIRTSLYLDSATYNNLLYIAANLHIPHRYLTTILIIHIIEQWKKDTRINLNDHISDELLCQ